MSATGNPRVTFVISALGPGGAERTLVTMANYWSSHDWPITIVTLAPAAPPPFFDVAPAVEIRNLGLSGRSAGAVEAVRTNVRRLLVLRREIIATSPDVVISFMDQTNVLTLLALTGSGTPVVVGERSDPSAQILARPWRELRALTYPRASAVVALTREVMDWFPTRIRRRGFVIPNPATLPPAMPRPGRPHVIVAMGRLGHEKGFDLLLRAFALIAPEIPGWTVRVWGEGDHRDALTSLRADLHLDDRVEFPGLTREPARELAAAGFFVLSSHYESFGNVIVEAMAVGTPVVAFDCPSGPRSIIRDGVDGLLVPPRDVPALATAMRRLALDPHERRRLGAAAQDILRRFDVNHVMAQWERVVRDAIEARR